MPSEAWFTQRQYQDLGPCMIPPCASFPAGPVLMGSDPTLDTLAITNEMPQHVVVVPSFAMALYPVSVQEYARAIEAA